VGSGRYSLCPSSRVYNLRGHFERPYWRSAQKAFRPYCFDLKAFRPYCFDLWLDNHLHLLQSRRSLPALANENCLHSSKVSGLRFLGNKKGKSLGADLPKRSSKTLGSNNRVRSTLPVRRLQGAIERRTRLSLGNLQVQPVSILPSLRSRGPRLELQVALLWQEGQVLAHQESCPDGGARCVQLPGAGDSGGIYQAKRRDLGKGGESDRGEEPGERITHIEVSPRPK
jgi:hypothetical protein